MPYVESWRKAMEQAMTWVGEVVMASAVAVAQAMAMAMAMAAFAQRGSMTAAVVGVTTVAEAAET